MAEEEAQVANRIAARAHAAQATRAAARTSAGTDMGAGTGQEGAVRTRARPAAGKPKTKSTLDPGLRVAAARCVLAHVVHYPKRVVISRLNALFA